MTDENIAMQLELCIKYGETRAEADRQTALKKGYSYLLFMFDIINTNGVVEPKYISVFVKDLNDVLDGQNYITNNAAVSMSDMASATSEAASIASQYGVKINELSSLIAVATAKTRESGSETGNALKTLFINLQDTTSKPIREAFEAVGISMTKMVNGAEKLKTPIELLKELSKAFNELPEGDTRRANILSDIGGKFYHVMQKCITRMNLIAGNALEPCTTI